MIQIQIYVFFCAWAALIRNSTFAIRINTSQPNIEPNKHLNDPKQDLTLFCVLDCFSL